MMDARWVNVATDDDGDFIDIEVPPFLRGNVDFSVGWEVLQALVFNV